PKDAPNPALAHAFINFLLEPDVAARNANFVKYASPNQAARDKIDPQLLADPAVYPPAAVLERCQWLLDRGPAIKKIERVWPDGPPGAGGPPNRAPPGLPPYTP